MRPHPYFAAASLAALCLPAAALAQTSAAQATHTQGASGPTAPAPDVAGAAAAGQAATVVVTANRSPLAIDQVGQSVTVLTRDEIELDQETNVADILVRTPGLNLVRNGGPGQPTSVFIRGADSDHTVVLIDGVKVNDVSSPGVSFDFSSLLTGDISRIEVLRGPQSTLYGSAAIGGVVNVVTADATRPLEASAQVEGGSYGTGYANGAVGSKGERYDLRLGAFYSSSDSVSAFDKAFGGREDDGFHEAGVQGRFRYDLTPDLQFDERVYYTAGRNEFDGNDTPTFALGDDPEFSRTQHLVDYTGLNLSLFDGRLKNRLALEYEEDDTRDEAPYQLDSDKATFDGLGRATTLDYEGTFALAPHYTLVFGAQDERSTINTDGPAYFEPVQKNSKSISSGYGQITGEVLHGLTLTGGVRYDADSAFGGHTTGQASAAWAVQPGTILRASYGGGFKAPSLYQLYSSYGFPGLKPETANGWDAGVEQHFLRDRLVVQATYFGRETSNLIEFVSCFDDTGLCASHPFGFYQNVDKSRAEGLELQADLKPVEHLDITANYTFDDDEDRSPGSTTRGLQLIRRPKNTANLAATYVWPVKLSTTVAVRYAGQSFDEDFSAGGYVVLHSYALVDLRASYPLTDALELYGRVENLADKAYETTYQYGTLGRAAYGGVRVKF
jgi:vitamin B12 transporter